MNKLCRGSLTRVLISSCAILSALAPLHSYAQSAHNAEGTATTLLNGFTASDSRTTTNNPSASYNIWAADNLPFFFDADESSPSVEAFGYASLFGEESGPTLPGFLDPIFVSPVSEEYDDDDTGGLFTLQGASVDIYNDLFESAPGEPISLGDFIGTKAEIELFSEFQIYVPESDEFPATLEFNVYFDVYQDFYGILDTAYIESVISAQAAITNLVSEEILFDSGVFSEDGYLEYSFVTDATPGDVFSIAFSALLSVEIVDPSLGGELLVTPTSDFPLINEEDFSAFLSADFGTEIQVVPEPRAIGILLSFMLGGYLLGKGRHKRSGTPKAI